MGKVAVTYVGTHDDLTTEITFGKHHFVKGEVVQIDSDDPSMAKLEGNPTFEVGKEAASAAKEAKKEVRAQESEEA